MKQLINVMKKITNKINGEVIYCHGIDEINNMVRYQHETAQGEPIVSGIVYCPELWDVIDNYPITETNARELSYNIGTQAIYDYNLLDLNLEDWEVL